MKKKELLRACWQDIATFYKELIEKYHWNQEPMLKVLDQLERCGLYSRFFPSTSHEALILSAFYEYEQRRVHPSVAIIYHPNQNEIVLQFIKTYLDAPLKKHCGPELSESDLMEIAQWLD